MNNHIKESVLEKINSEEVSMKPHYYFVLKVVGFVFLAVGIFLTSAFIISYVLFSIRTAHHFNLIGYGEKGIIAFLMFFPWRIFAIDIVLILLLERLMKQFRFGYRSPALYLFGSLFVLAALAGFAFDQAQVHKSLQIRNKQGKMPFVGPLYDNLRRPHGEEGIARGFVMSIATSTFMLRDSNPECFHPCRNLTLVEVSPDFNTFEKVHQGDWLFVAGDRQPDGHIKAYGVTNFGPGYKDQD